MSLTQPRDPWGTVLIAVVPPFVTTVRCGQQQGQLTGVFIRMGMSNTLQTQRQHKDVMPVILYFHLN